MVENPEGKLLAGYSCPRLIILSAVTWFIFYSYPKVIGDQAIKQDWAVL